MLDAWVLWRLGRRGSAAICLLGTSVIAVFAMVLGLGAASMIVGELRA
jgi:hypothetical protein